MRNITLPHGTYNDETPLRLEIAAKIAFPDGSIGPPGLRKERDAGRLETEMIAGKEFVTLAAIARMRELCRVKRKVPDSTGETKAVNQTDHYAIAPVGSSEMERRLLALAAARQTGAQLKEHLQHTSRKNTSQNGRKAATPLPR